MRGLGKVGEDEFKQEKEMEADKMDIGLLILVPLIVSVVTAPLWTLLFMFIERKVADKREARRRKELHEWREKHPGWDEIVMPHSTANRLFEAMYTFKQKK
jgi:hypothetical protein